MSATPPISLAVLRPRCKRQRCRAKALHIQERWPSVDVIQLEFVKGVTRVLACRDDTRSLALYRAAHTANSTSTSVSMRDPGPGTVRKTSEKTPYGCERIRSWCVVINVNCLLARVVRTVKSKQV